MDMPCYYRVSIKGLAIDEAGRFLLQRETDGAWDLPGGGLEYGEKPHIGLKRELQEEAGLEITSISDAPKYFMTGERSSGKSWHAFVVYEIGLKDLNFTPSDECQELRYFTVEEAAKLDLLVAPTKLLEVYDPRNHIN